MVELLLYYAKQLSGAVKIKKMQITYFKNKFNIEGIKENFDVLWPIEGGFYAVAFDKTFPGGFFFDSNDRYQIQSTESSTRHFITNEGVAQMVPWPNQQAEADFYDAAKMCSGDICAALKKYKKLHVIQPAL